jgi:hypothetical protein
MRLLTREHTTSSQLVITTRFLVTDLNNVLYLRSSWLANVTQLTHMFVVISHKPPSLLIDLIQITQHPTCPAYNISARTAQKTLFLTIVVQMLALEHVCLRSHYSLTAFVYLLISRSLPSNGCTCYNMLYFSMCFSN